MPFKTLVDKIDQVDLTRTITNSHRGLYEVNKSTSKPQTDINQMSKFYNNIDNLAQNNIKQFENVVCNVLNGM